MVLVAPVAAVVCVGLAATGWWLLRSTGLEDVERALAPGSRADAAGDAAGRPPVVARALDALGRVGGRMVLSWYGTRRLDRLRRRLGAAGQPEGLDAEAFIRRQVGFALAGLVAAGFFAGSGQPVLAVVVLVGCTSWMSVWLRTVAARRQAAIARALPDFLDVLTVTVSAGLSLPVALDRVSADDPGPLGDEIRRVLDDLRYGRGRRRALADLRRRNAAPSMGSFVTAVLQAEELGTPVAQVLSEIAADVRREFAQDARRRAARAGPKVSLAVTTFIVPGAMLLIIAALVLANLPRFREVFG
ncbi:MAG: type II secretion system F family protein [Angustibacter sp.]